MNDKYLIVAEGPQDANLLRQITDIPVAITRGKYISRETILFLKEVNKTRKIIILTDPDGPGKYIKDKLNNELKDTIFVEVDNKKCRKKDKVGVAYCKKEYLEDLLHEYIVKETPDSQKITHQDLIDLGLTGKDSKNLRNRISSSLSIGTNLSAKAFLERVNILGIKLDELKKYYE